MKILSYSNILETIKNRNRIPRLMFLLIGTFIIALFYNSFVVPNNLVYGGIGGLAIVVDNIFHIGTTLFINVGTIVLIILSYFLVGFQKTSSTIIGFLAYSIMITLTAPLAKMLNFTIDSFLLSVIVYAMFMGLGYGLIYRAGYNTGGADSVVLILQKFFPFPTAKISNIINGIIVVLGLANFGIEKSLYALIFLKICNFIADQVLLGVSTSKLCFIKSNKISIIEQYLREELEVGYTLIESTNGIGILKKSIIMCVVPTDRFYDLKHELSLIDKKATIISKDCYTVIGGYTNKLLPI